MMLRGLIGLALAMALVGVPSIAKAAYPDHPIRLVVGYAAGGPTDALARALSEPLGAALGQPVVVDNHPGASGIAGADAVAKARPDGYTIGVGTAGNLAIRPAAQAGIPYDARQDLQPISLVATVPNILLVSPSLPVATVGQLIDYARGRPGTLSYASTGPGNTSHLTAELFKILTGLELAHAPYRGSEPALNDLMSGQVQIMFATMRSSIQHVRSNAVRALAVTGRVRSPWKPDLPTMSEAGVVGCEFTAWFGVFGPKGMAPQIVERLHGEIMRAMETPGMKAHLIQLGAEPIGSTAAEFAQRLDIEIAKWSKVAKTAGITVN
jgi:tripartite-type tricarboxylate transporter receptor subunit TctC